MSRKASILAEAFPNKPTCLSLVNMDETDLEQLRRRIAIVRRVAESLKGDLRLITSDSGASALGFLQKASVEMNTGGIDLRQENRSMHLNFPPQDGVRRFRIEADVAMPRLDIDEDGAWTMMDALLRVYDAVLDLPNGGHDGTPDVVAAAARRATSIVSALHAADGRNGPGTCVYVPRTPWRPAEIVRHKAEGGGSFLRKPAASVILADDPVCVSISRADDWYHVKGAPTRQVLAGTVPDTVEALRLLASIDPSIAPTEALVQRKGAKS